MKKLIVANWKSNPPTLAQAIRLAKASDFKNVIIAPPHVYLDSLSKILKNASLGAQNTFSKDGGPYTGEVSPRQIKSLKAEYVILGHSERRKYLAETDEIVNEKVKLAIKKGLKVVLCVGENWSTRRKGIATAKEFVANQLNKDLIQTKNLKLKTKNLLIAYEPVWAIGTGKADTPKNAAEMMGFIKDYLNSKLEIRNSKLLYGGSVTPENAEAFLAQPEIDGALIGSSSLIPQQFKTIIKIRDSL